MSNEISPRAQLQAIETARRIVLGGLKAPKAGSSQGKLLAIQLDRAAQTLSTLNEETPHAA